MQAAMIHPGSMQYEGVVERARSGDLESFNELVVQYQALVYNVCWRLLNDSEAAEDATQETFISAWRHIGQLRGEFRPWLMRIASNAAKNELRRRVRRGWVSLDDEMSERALEPATEDPSPEDAALQRELRDEVAGVLEQVPWEQRRAAILWHFGNLDYAEIAAATQTNIGTVRSRINRGRRLAREILLRSHALQAVASA